MYSLRILFFSLPLYFSHVLSPLGVTIGESYSFERYKVYLLLILVIAAYMEFCIRQPQHIITIFYKYFFPIIGVICIPVVSALYFDSSIDMDWLLGSHEKHHGYLFYIAIILLITLIVASSREQIRSYINWSISAALIVTSIAIGEYIGGIVDIYGRSGANTAYPGRTVGTLGNPNYMAGYLLMILPLLDRWRSPERWLATVLCVIAILTTGSYIALFLMGIYFCYLFLRYVGLSKLRALYLVIGLMIFACVFGYYLLDQRKMLSLISRFVLMRDVFSTMLHTPFSFLVGFGPDSIISHFSQGRSLVVGSYFPGNMLIDSSHNIIIDILFQYGIVPILLIGGYLYRHWGGQKEDLQIAILLGVIFLALNVFVISHIIILILLLIAYTRNREV